MLKSVCMLQKNYVIRYGYLGELSRVAKLSW